MKKKPQTADEAVKAFRRVIARAIAVRHLKQCRQPQEKPAKFAKP